MSWGRPGFMAKIEVAIDMRLVRSEGFEPPTF